MRSTAAPLSATPPAISRGQLIRELSVFATPRNKSGALLLLRDGALYWGLWAAVLFAPAIGWKILASVLLGIRLTSMYTLAHDASHRTLFASRRWNWIAALALGVPSVQNYRMWTHDHNHVHHPRTNGDHFDFYRPFSKAEYDALSPLQQLAERLCRAPNVFGLFVYWLVRWIPTRVWPNVRTPQEQRGVSMAYAVPLLLFHGGMVAFLALVAPRIAPIDAGTAVLLGWLGPLMLHFWISSATLYLMHTHPNIPWFKGDIARSGDYAPELCSTVLTTPDWFSKMVNNVYCHAAHHAHHGIPSYLLLPAQKRMNALLGNRLVVEPLSLFSMLRTLRTCKLYDFERHQWTDFDGLPTAAPINLSARNAVAEKAVAPQRQPQQQPATA
ncbi:fatty acid desaturase [Pseudorhodoferax sp. Leaf265]|uniref:fatty acid desaturase family protein n=1 Tax=Pseudorhodoferax sp. Leaf265 TaxID=1736315 RepID=UPI0009E87F18|nr:fatty acid desaturase [Pseudorhodoferax sp. Leaf265]